MSTTVQLDLKGLSCPLPVLRAHKAIKELIPGDVLELQVTDPAAPSDFENFCETTGHELLGSEAAEGVFTISIRKRD